MLMTILITCAWGAGQYAMADERNEAATAQVMAARFQPILYLPPVAADPHYPMSVEDTVLPVATVHAPDGKALGRASECDPAALSARTSLRFDPRALPAGRPAAYYHYIEEIFRGRQYQIIEWWFFYPLNHLEFRVLLPVRQYHDGDWESIAVVADEAGVARYVIYCQHNGCFVRRLAGEATEYHPEVWVGIGSHCSLPGPKRRYRAEPCEKERVAPRSGWRRLTGRYATFFDRTAAPPTARVLLPADYAALSADENPWLAQYPGHWGRITTLATAWGRATSGPSSPAGHARYWTAPLSWAMKGLRVE